MSVHTDTNSKPGENDRLSDVKSSFPACPRNVTVLCTCFCGGHWTLVGILEASPPGEGPVVGGLWGVP